MPVYLVERYLPDVGAPDVRRSVARTRAFARNAARQGQPVRYLWSAFIPAEETCLCLFEASDREVVGELNRQAGFTFDRIVEAVSLVPGRPADEPDPTIGSPD